MKWLQKGKSINMKKVLYVSNIEVPYRTEFFNMLSKKCDLTVLYERESVIGRNEQWCRSIENNFKEIFFRGINIKNEFSFSLKMIKYILVQKYDIIIFGCYNSLVQIVAMYILKILNKDYILNIDGEYFLEGNSIKQKLKRRILSGAQYYLVAGETNIDAIKKISKKNNVKAYYFSTLKQDEIENNEMNKNNVKKINNILVVGRYSPEKGQNLVLEIAKVEKDLNFKFIGSDNKSKELKNRIENMNLKNVDVVPFLNKEKLNIEYRKAGAIIVPSIKECWGLIINEAASFGVPIIASNQTGAAVEFLGNEYAKYLFESGNVKDLRKKIELLKKDKKIIEYKKYLINKSKLYSVEKMVECYMEVINGGENK